MKKFSDTLKNINESKMKKIRSEVKSSKGSVYSVTLNDILAVNYPQVDNEFTNSRKQLFTLWKPVIEQAAGARDGKITRTWIDVYAALDRIIKVLYPLENTSEAIFTQFRKPIRDKYGDSSEIYKQSIYKMGVSKERSIQRKEEYQNKVMEKGLNRQDLKPFYDDEIYNAIDQGSNSTNPIENIIAVMLTTGSRLIEVLKVSTFNETDKPNFIKITGIAKDKARKGYENKVIIRPLIRLTAKEIVELVKKIRDQLNVAGDNNAVSDRYNSQVNRIVKKIFPDQSPTSHKLRYIAANMAYILYGKGGTANIYIQGFLGHESGETSRTYQSINVQLRKEVSAPRIDTQARLNNLEHEITKNEKDHKQIKQEIAHIENPAVVEKAIELPLYPNCVNPRGKTTKAAKFELLGKLKQLAATDGRTISTRQLKSQYHYGSNLITEFNKLQL